MDDNRAIREGQRASDAGDRMVTLPSSALGVLMSVADGVVTATVVHCGEHGYPVSSYIAEALAALTVAEAAILEAR